MTANLERSLIGPACTTRVMSVTPAGSCLDKKFFWMKSFNNECLIDSFNYGTYDLGSFSENVRICSPKLIAGLLVWGPFEKACSLWDLLVEASTNYLLDEVKSIYAKLGMWLRNLHDGETRIKVLAKHRYDEEYSPYWNAAVKNAERHGISISDCAAFKHTTLIHGGLGLSSINYDADLSIIGWEKSGLGDPLFDVSYVLSELLEMHCAFDGDRSRALVVLAKAFCDSYYKRCKANRDECSALSNSIVRKAAIHLSMFGFFFNEWDTAVDQYIAVKKTVNEFLHDAGVGLKIRKDE